MDEVDQQSPELLNPWFDIWTRPRAVIQQMVDIDPKRHVLALAAIAGFSQALDRACMRSAGDTIDWPIILILAAVFGPIGGVLSLYFGAFVMRWTGNWIGGRASSEYIRAAMAWSSVPIIWLLIIWIPELALFGQELFTTETPTIDANLSLGLLMFGLAMIEITVAIWAFVIYLKCLGQVQGFSAWKALGNVALTFMVILVPILLLGLTIVNLVS